VFSGIHSIASAELNDAREEHGCHLSCLMVTDITSGRQPLPPLRRGGKESSTRITYPEAGENLFEMAGVLSRKKQMMP